MRWAAEGLCPSWPPRGSAESAKNVAAAARRPRTKESAMAKGQKKSNREIRKPKAEKPKAAVAAPSFLTPPSKKK